MKKVLFLFLLFLITNYSITNCCLAQQEPSLTIVSPQENQKVFGNKVIFSFFVSDFILNIDGYLQVSLNGNKPFIIKEQRDFPLTNIAEGKHVLSAELINKKRQSFLPIIEKEVVFETVFSKKESSAINLEISPVKTKKTIKEKVFLIALLSIGGAILIALAFKFYVNTKTG